MKNEIGHLMQKKRNQKQVVRELLDKYGKVSTDVAVVNLNVSESTVRRLFNAMEQEGEAIRTYGGIVKVRTDPNEYLFEDFRKKQPDEKYRIGKIASSLVNDGDIVFMDSGTTVQQAAFFLSQRLRNNEVSGIKVFTNSMVIIETLADLCEVCVLGGMYRKNRQDFCGFITEIVIDSLSFDISFNGADGILVEKDGGVYASDQYTALMSRSAVGKCKKNYVLCDSTKFSKHSLVKYGTWSTISAIITDRMLDDGAKETLERQGIEVIRV